MKKILTILLCLLAGFPSLMGQERDTLLTVDAELTDDMSMPLWRD